MDENVENLDVKKLKKELDNLKKQQAVLYETIHIQQANLHEMILAQQAVLHETVELVVKHETFINKSIPQLFSALTCDISDLIKKLVKKK